MYLNLNTAVLRFVYHAQKFLLCTYTPMYIPRGTPRITWLLSLKQPPTPVAQIHIFFIFRFTALILAQKVLTLIRDPSVTLGFRLNFFFWGGGLNSPPVGQGLLIHEVSKSHTMTHHSR